MQGHTLVQAAFDDYDRTLAVRQVYAERLRR
jgi:hypothetical protein